MKTSSKYMFGTVSHATMREEDLIPRFLDCIRELDPERGEEITDEWTVIERDNPDDAYSCEDASMFLNETLFDVLNEYSAPYHYFGAHPGDGSDYGFWLCEEWRQLMEDDDVQFGDSTDGMEDGEACLVSDHGNIEFGTVKDGKFTSIFSYV